MSTRTRTDTRNSRKAIYRKDVITILAFSSAPLTIGLSNGSSNPVLSGVLITVGQLTMLLCLIKFVLIKSKSKPTIREIISFAVLSRHWNKEYIWSNETKKWEEKPKKEPGLFKNMWNKYALIGVIPIGFYWLLFAWSIKFLGIAVTSVVLGLLLIVCLILGYFVDYIYPSWVNFVKSTWALLILFVAGIIIIISHADVNQTSYYKGVLILIVCIISGIVGLKMSSKWAERMNEKWQKIKRGVRGKEGEDIIIQRRMGLKVIWHPSLGPKPVDPEEIETVFRLLSIIIGLILSFILIILGSVFWILQGNTWDLSFASNSIDLFTNKVVIINTVAWIICIVGGFITAIGVWSLRVFKKQVKYRGFEDKRSSIYRVCLYSLIPILTLVCLFPFGLVQLQDRDYLLFGVLIILATSILIPLTALVLDTETRIGIRWLIIFLWSTGILIYFREKWIQWPWLADGTTWEWSIGSVDYYSLIVLTATIFILIFSFRYNRLVKRTNSEEDQYIRINTMIDKLHDSLCYTANTKFLAHFENEYPILANCSYLKECLDRIDKDEDKDDDRGPTDRLGTRLQYKKLISHLKYSIQLNPEHEEYEMSEYEGFMSPPDQLLIKGLAKETLSDSELKDLEKLSDLELEMELFYRSKQRGRYIAESLVLYTFSLVTIIVTIGTRPTVISHWNALIIDVLAFLFSSAICFMTINLLDLRAYREKPTRELMTREGHGQHRNFEAKNQKAVQVISIIFTVVISISFVVLLYDKWMGIWFL